MLTQALLTAESSIGAVGAGTAYPTPASGGMSYAISPATGGSMWFTNGSLNKVTGDGAITTVSGVSGTVSYFTSTSSSNPWFAISGLGGPVGTVDSNGTVTEYATGLSLAQVISLTIGRDSRPWFVDQSGRLGTVTAAGAVNMVGSAVTSANIGVITTGPTDAAPLWATDFGNDAILKYQTDGSVPTKYDLTSGDDPNGIAVGADGNLWFTAYAGNYIGKITTSGAITRYPVPTAASTPDLIALGPDGAMWFTERAADKIGRISTDGTITEYAVPAGTSQPVSIAADQLGNMWVSFAGAKFVAKIATGVTPTSAGPTLAGTGEYGLSLVCGGDTWSVTPISKSTSWYADGALIAGSSGTAYAPSADQVGKAITCKVTAQLPYMRTDLVATSNPITVVKPGDSPVSTLVVTLQPGPIKGVSGKSVNVKFNASMAAAVTMNVMAKSKVRISSNISAVQGTNKATIKLKVKKKALKPGTYSLTVVSGAGKTLDTVKLKVAKAKKK